VSQKNASQWDPPHKCLMRSTKIVVPKSTHVANPPAPHCQLPSG